MKAAIYARVSTVDQEPENQLQELRRYVEARGWAGTEFVDHGVSGAKDRRPALLDVGGFFYWTMGWPIGALEWGWDRLTKAGTILINRKPLAGAETASESAGGQAVELKKGSD